MKKIELLSPAGDMECLKAAIHAGCDAVYLGGKLFGARAFSNNFDNDQIIEAINYSHLYGVKVYVTLNTIIYEHEVEKFMNYVDFLYKNNVDALIIQDIGMMDLIRKTYPNLELHASTQMHIHNIEGVRLVEKSGLKRVVLARETSIDTIEYIKENTNIDLEIFVHGALCISYSGQCLMSSLIGNRSGNRGSCAGSCRQKYTLMENNKDITKEQYLLSAKDLCSLESIGDLIDIGVDSLKIEGRMKSKEYVYMVTKIYRQAIDSYIKNKKVIINNDELIKLKTIFNREYTKGFLNNEANNNITNPIRPNHLGIEIGEVITCKKGFITIKLTDKLNINDGIRFKDSDIGFIVTSMFKNKQRIKSANKEDIISIPYNKKDIIKGKVVKTTDYLLNQEIDKILKEEPRKVEIKGILIANINKPLELQITDGMNDIIVKGNKVEKSINQPLTKERIISQISKIGDTIYKFSDLKIKKDEDIFISIKELNDLKKEATRLLNEKRLYRYEYNKQEYSIDVPDFQKENNYNILISNLEQYEMIKNNDFKYIYLYDDLYSKIDDKRKILKLPRVINNFENYKEDLLIGELGGLNKYKSVSTDFSFNVVNSYSVAFLHNLGVKQVTLSVELTDTQIKNLMDAYHKRYNKHPNLELIIFGKIEAMISKYNLNQRYNVNKSYLVDRFKNKYPIVIKNGIMTIYDYKTRNLKESNKYFNLGVNNLRYNLLDEDNLNI